MSWMLCLASLELFIVLLGSVLVCLIAWLGLSWMILGEMSAWLRLVQVFPLTLYYDDHFAASKMDFDSLTCQ